MEVYINADYARSIADRRSTWGYCMFLDGNSAALSSEKQNVVSQSSAEAESESSTIIY